MSRRPYSVQVPLRWSDMDAYGHVNNVQYLRLMEDARITAFQAWFGPRNTLLSSGCLVARSEIEYLAPLPFQHEGVLIDVPTIVGIKAERDGISVALMHDSRWARRDRAPSRSPRASPSWSVRSPGVFGLETFTAM